MIEKWLSAELQAAALEKIGVALRQPRPFSALVDAMKELSDEQAEVVVNRMVEAISGALQKAQQDARIGLENNVAVHCSECQFAGVAARWGGECPVCHAKLLPGPAHQPKGD